MAVAARREVVRQLQERGLSERQALRLVGMSASTLRYEPCDDGNEGLRERLKELAGQHRRDLVGESAEQFCLWTDEWGCHGWIELHLPQKYELASHIAPYRRSGLGLARRSRL